MVGSLKLAKNRVLLNTIGAVLFLVCTAVTVAIRLGEQGSGSGFSFELHFHDLLSVLIFDIIIVTGVISLSAASLAKGREKSLTRGVGLLWIIATIYCFSTMVIGFLLASIATPDSSKPSVVILICGVIATAIAYLLGVHNYKLSKKV